MLFIGGAFICNGGWGASICGAICILGSAVSFLDAGRGWKMKDTRPPWADKHDEINRRGEERLKRYLKESTDD
jgi:beta-lactamase superfamily II metal-dependent hydrolase